MPTREYVQYKHNCVINAFCNKPSRSNVSIRWYSENQLKIWTNKNNKIKIKNQKKKKK